MTDARLCSICEEIFHKVWTGREFDLLGRTLNGIKGSADEGFLMWKNLHVKDRKNFEECTKLTFQFFEGRRYGSRYCRNKYCGDDRVEISYYTSSGGSTFICKLKCWPAKEPLLEALDLSTGAQLGESTNNETSFAIARHWIHDCIKSHKICNEASNTLKDFYLPIRLIDLGPRRDFKPRLCNSKGIPPHSEYITLSHRWGEQASVSLTTSVETSFFVELPTELPKTFKEAIYVTKKLGIRYLWIDSLCIVQDSVEDWRRESRMMDHVYQHSWCTLAATKAENSHAGLFTERSWLHLLPFQVSSSKSPYYCDEISLLDSDIWLDIVERSPLLRRAWVIQERILSRSILHFAKGQIYWECLELRACEAYPGGIPFHVGCKLSMHPHSLNEYPAFGNSRWELWHHIVQEYSECNLKYPEKDKLIALAGLARHMGCTENYLAGLWKESLPSQLMWLVRSHNGELNSRSAKYRAPSWSWARVDGPILFHHMPWKEDDPKALISILGARVSCANDDPFGAVKGGMLQVNGNLFCTTVREREEPWPSSSTQQYYVGQSRAALRLDIGVPEDTSCLYFLVVQGYNHPVMSGFSGIIVEPTTRTGEYSRCGYFHMFDEVSGDGNVERFEGLLYNRLMPGTYEKYLGRDRKWGFHRYQISII